MQSVKELVDELQEFTIELNALPTFRLSVDPDEIPFLASDLMRIRRIPSINYYSDNLPDPETVKHAMEDIREGRVLTVEEILKLL